jgi:heme/copper-type cytochrome/quinol oxidase subunit 1
MPRRIPDFPDSYSGWNLVSSFGSLVSVIATILFGYVIFDLFSTKQISGNNPWGISSFFDDEMKFHLIETFKQLEWAVASPAPEHCFTSKPKQS